jgi:hypothetical protein
MPVILATQEAEIRWIKFEASLRQKKFERPYLEKNSLQKGTGGVTQGVGPKFKPSTSKKSSFVHHCLLNTVQNQAYSRDTKHLLTNKYGDTHFMEL